MSLVWMCLVLGEISAARLGEWWGERPGGEVAGALEFSEGVVTRMARLEANLEAAGVALPPTMGPLAANLSRRGYVIARAARLIYDVSRTSGEGAWEEVTRLEVPGWQESLPCPAAPFRSHSGLCTQPHHSTSGAAFTPYARLAPPAYSDGLWEAGEGRKSGGLAARVSALVTGPGEESHHLAASFLPAWAALVFADLAHTKPFTMFSSGAGIRCCEEGRKLPPRLQHPLCLPLIDRLRCTDYVRSALSPTRHLGPAQQMNFATHSHDASFLYGSSEDSANKTRTFKGGRIRNHPEGLVRVEEFGLGYELVSNLLGREHNRLAGQLSAVNPSWVDEMLYQQARRILTAQLQHITYSHWLPTLIGDENQNSCKGGKGSKLCSYEGFKPNEDPSVLNSFANAVVSFIYSMIKGTLGGYSEERKLKETVNGRTRAANLSSESVTSLIRGLATQAAAKPDLHFSTMVLKQMGGEGVDGVAVLVQRGRDHGIPSYTSFRHHLGLPSLLLSKSVHKQAQVGLRKAYRRTSEVDLAIGGLAEGIQPGSMLGPVFTDIIRKQMTRTRDSDYYYYKNKDQPLPFSQSQLMEIEKSSLAGIICENELKITSLQRNVFLQISERNPIVDCGSIPKVDITAWKYREYY